MCAPHLSPTQEWETPLGLFPLLSWAPGCRWKASSTCKRQESTGDWQHLAEGLTVPSSSASRQEAGAQGAPLMPTCLFSWLDKGLGRACAISCGCTGRGHVARPLPSATLWGNSQLPHESFNPKLLVLIHLKNVLNSNLLITVVHVDRKSVV